MPDARLPFRIVVQYRNSCLLVAALVACACSDDGSDPVQPDPCAGQARLEVWGGTQPTFAWAPACGVHHLVVVEVTPGSQDRVMWITGSPLKEGLAPPVRYPEVGAGPDGSRAEPLVSGRHYRVRLDRWRTGGGFCLMGCPANTSWSVEATFTP